MSDKFYNNDSFLARWLAGELSEQERLDFESHPDFAAFDRIAQASEQLRTPFKQSKEEAWSQFLHKTQAQATPKTEAKVRPMKTRRWAMGIAAAVLLLVGFFMFNPFSSQQAETFAFDTTIQSQRGEQKSYTLPDGSEVVLNADSKIAFNQEAFGKQRTLELDGEAFFKVKKGSKFLVETANGGFVQVLGTSFNVAARKNTLDVACYTGKVGVFFDKQKDEMSILTANKRLIAENKVLVANIDTEDTTKTPNWTQGESRFVQAKMTDVLEEIERQFNVKISYPNEIRSIADYNGGFPHSDLKTVLDIIVTPIGYQYKVNGKEVSIFK